MATIKCPQCGIQYEVEESTMGKVVSCGVCGKNFVASLAKTESPPVSVTPPIPMPVPAPRPTPIATGSDLSPCRYCGEMISPKTLCCPRCGAHKLYRPWLVLSYLAYIGLIVSIAAAVIIIAAEIIHELTR